MSRKGANLMPHGGRKWLRTRRYSWVISLKLLEDSKTVLPTGVEIWNARTLYKILGYQDWTNFRGVIQKAIMACDNSGVFSTNHFREFTDMIEVGKGQPKD